MKTALIFGSSGLVGNQLLNIIVQKNNFKHIKLFVRTVLKNNNSKVETFQTDFINLEKHKNSIVGDDCFFCIGTTRKDTPDKNEYRRIEYNIPINVAQIAKSNSVDSFVYVSSLGANPTSSGFYLKNNLKYRPMIICTGAAIAYLTKDQAPINNFIDKIYLGWLLRIIFHPSAFFPRYIDAFKLFFLVLKNKITISFN